MQYVKFRVPYFVHYFNFRMPHVVPNNAFYCYDTVFHSAMVHCQNF